MEMDLEQEFQKLMRTVIRKINDKLEDGELTADEAGELTRMVMDRTATPPVARGWDNSMDSCTIDQDEGWTGSTTQCW